MKQEIDKLAQKVAAGEVTGKEANNRIKSIIRHYNLFIDVAQSYYDSKMSEIGDEAR